MDKYCRDQVLCEDIVQCSRLFLGRCLATNEPVTIHERYHRDAEAAGKVVQIGERLQGLQGIQGVLRTIEGFVGQEGGSYVSIFISEPIVRTLRQEIETRKPRSEKWANDALQTIIKSLLETLQSAHDLDICHGSISDTSVFLTPNGLWKLGLFEHSHFNFRQNLVDPSSLQPYLSPASLTYLHDPTVALDWHQADIFSLGVVFIAMATLGDIEFLWRSPSDKHEEAILKLEYKSAVIEVIAGMVTDALGEKTTLKQAICLLVQDKLTEDIRKKDGIVVENLGANKDKPEEDKEETYTCSFCSENTGRLTAAGYSCLNPECSVNSECDKGVSYCPICSHEFDPAAPWAGSSVAEEQRAYVSLVCSSPCLEKLLSIGSPTKCPICSATPPKDCSWKPRHPEIPSEQLNDICSFACFQVQAQIIGDDTCWGQACLQCGKVTKQTTAGKIISLECSTDHVFCCYKCMKVFAKGHGNTDVLCPICAIPFHFPTMRGAVKQRKVGSGSSGRCCMCQKACEVMEMKCKHQCCIQCVSAASDDIGYRRCPLPGCGQLEEV